MTTEEDEFPVMTSGRIRRMPNQPKTPQKTFRIPQDLYEAAQVAAAEKGERVSDVVRRCLERYVKQQQRQPTPPPQ